MKFVAVRLVVALLATSALEGRCEETKAGVAAVESAQQIDPAARWHKLLAEADRDAIYDTFALIGKLRGAGDGADAEACEANKEAINTALQVNSVGLAMWYAAYQCAVALHQDELAAQRLRVFSALVRYGVESRPPDNEQTPIRVLSPLDVDAFILASGQTLLYSYYDASASGRVLPLHISLWDAETKHERLLTFDFLDSRVQLSRATREAEFPAFRHFLADSLLTSLGKNEGSPAAVALQLRKAMQTGNAAKRLTAVKAVARGGNFGAVALFAQLCMGEAGCAAEAIDMLLPWAEDSNAVAMVLLAVAYEQGSGVKQNSDNAIALVKAADRRLGDGRATILFAAASMLHHKDLQFSPAARAALEPLAEKHLPMAEGLLAAAAVKQTKGTPLPAKTLAMLQHAAQTGIPSAQELLAAYLVGQDKQSEAMPWIENAAAGNRSDAQRQLAQAYEHGEGKPKDLDLARKWYTEAGRSGDAASMVWMAHYYHAQPRSAKNLFAEQGWLQSAALSGSVPGALDLAQLYLNGGEGIEGDASNAAQIYKELDRSFNSAEARRLLAEMLAYSTKVPQDREEAERLLRLDADRGEVKSQVKLGWMLGRGTFGKERMEEGRQMLRKAADTGDPWALVEYGNTLYYGVEHKRHQALELWQRATEKGDVSARNNLAWALCTSPDPQLLDGKRGLELAKSLDEGDATPLGYSDTLAACYARAGDFEKAASVEQGALEQAQARRPQPKEFMKMAGDRIAMYQERKAYSEEEGKQE